MNFIDPFMYYSGCIEFKKDSIIININNLMDSEDEIYNIYYEELGYPGYTRNWDAFQDFLGDLEWIDKKYTYLVHEELPNLSNEDLRIYIEVLYSTLCFRSIEVWPGDTNLVVAFNVKNSDKIHAILNRYIKYIRSDPDYEPHPLGYY